MRLDRYLAHRTQSSRQDVRRWLAGGRVRVDGEVTCAADHQVRAFSHVSLDDNPLQAGKAARYLMLHKPAGCVSATRDAQHPTVLNLIDTADREDLHIAGRLDFNTTGLMLLTNDGQWSRRLTQPSSLQGKVYTVATEDEIDPGCIAAFAKGLYFRFENLTTLPAHLELLGPRHARLTLHEGRYHQVKRMFGHFRNKVTALHRESMGPLKLDSGLAPGEYRPLTPAEIAQI